MGPVEAVRSANRGDGCAFAAAGCATCDNARRVDDGELGTMGDCGAPASARAVALGEWRASTERTPCSLLLEGIVFSASSARGALGAVGGGLALRPFVTAAGALGAAATSTRDVGLSRLCCLALSTARVSSCAAVEDSGLLSAGLFVNGAGRLLAELGATEKLNAGTGGA